MMTKTVLEAAINLMPVASKDETRHHLCGVQMQNVDGGKVRLQSTNGHMAVIHHVSGSIPDGKYLLRRDTLKVAKAILDECDSFQEIECTIDMDKNLFYGHATKARIDKIEDYPNIKDVMPKHSYRAAICLNAEYILTLARVLREVRGGRGDASARIVFDPTDASKAALIEHDGNDDFQAVVMPMRQEGTTKIAEIMRDRLDPPPQGEYHGEDIQDPPSIQA